MVSAQRRLRLCAVRYPEREMESGLRIRHQLLFTINSKVTLIPKNTYPPLFFSGKEMLVKAIH